MTPKKMVIPAGLAFADLQLERELVTKRLLYRPGPLAELFRANALEPLLNDEDVVSWLIAEFYLLHRANGGEPDRVADEVLAEVAAAMVSDIPSLQPGGGREH